MPALAARIARTGENISTKCFLSLLALFSSGEAEGDKIAFGDSLSLEDDAIEDTEDREERLALLILLWLPL